MKIYIDAGAYNGDTLDCEKLFGFKADKKIAFEVNPRFIKKLQKTDAEVHHQAVWFRNAEIDVYIDKALKPLGTTVFSSKAKKLPLIKKIRVESIDFSEFVKNLDADEIVIKMDIEGAEFPVLDKMIKDNSFRKVKKLYCEFHPNKVTQYTTTDKNAIINRLKSFIEVEEWH